MKKTKKAADYLWNNQLPSVERTHRKNVPSEQSYHVAHIFGIGKEFVGEVD